MAAAKQLSGQIHLFDEAEALAQSTTDAQDIDPIPVEAASSEASVDFLAMLLAVKFVDGLPLTRFEYG
ncbi:MAG TPA: hypothetical protein DCP03_08440 [Polaromonas sp.]|uniref:hypothetical protein n=1 Tax=Polaromonas sp. UBA4122 TaxID=1947074 RepID=UPI000EBC4317|nr:hypothetical protein [Polaromonas sp. UBA4122]HAL38134.1 hypothetical protein [Polaromonas sp.]